MRESKVFSDRLDRLEDKLDKVLDLLTADSGEGGLIPPLTPSTSNIIEVKGIEAPWVIEALKWEGKSEVADKKELQDFLGFNPNDQDPDGQPWCAGFWNSIFGKLGIQHAHTLRASDYCDFGYECDEVDGAILVFAPDPESPYPISHVGVKIGDHLFGGNQGDSVKRSNLAWYKENAELVACRCPEGYKLV